eukprot:2222456-Amphidinium_carterae.1
MSSLCWDRTREKFVSIGGPKHYELLARARAVDNQCFVCAVSPARLPGFEYQASFVPAEQFQELRREFCAPIPFKSFRLRKKKKTL